MNSNASAAFTQNKSEGQSFVLNNFIIKKTKQQEQVFKLILSNFGIESSDVNICFTTSSYKKHGLEKGMLLSKLHIMAFLLAVFQMSLLYESINSLTLNL